MGVLLAHGLTATPAEVRLLAQRLHKQGLTVSGPLLPGHSATPEDLNRTRWQDWVRAVEADYRQLTARCEHVFVGGESMGAVIALYLASEHPEIAGVLTYAPAIKLALSWFDVLKLYLAAPFLASVPKKELDVDDMWQGYPVNPLRSVIELLRLQREVRPRLPRVHQPVLAVQGRLDTTIDPRCGEIICQGVSARLKETHWMEQSTHVVILDCELDQVTALTLRFIERALNIKLWLTIQRVTSQG